MFLLQVVRLGHPARLLSIVQQHSLDALVSSSEATAIVRDVRKDMDQTLVRILPSLIHVIDFLCLLRLRK